MSFLILVFVLLTHRFLTISALRNRFQLHQVYIDKMQATFSQKTYYRDWSGLGLLLFPGLVFILLLMLVFTDLAQGCFLPIFNLLVLFFALVDCEYQQRVEFKQQINAALHLFTLIFWFVFLGAFGVVLAKLLQVLTQKRSPVQDVAIKLYFYYAWLPARLLAASFSCVSHFSEVLGHWLLTFKSADNQVLLTQCASIALGKAYNSQRMTQLVDRALLIWMAILALIILA